VDHAPFVSRGQTGASLPRDFERPRFWKVADAAEQRRKVLPVHVLHREESVPLDFVDVVHPADVWMRDLPGHPDFGVQLGQPCRVTIHFRRQELQRDLLPELEIVGAEDFPHPAFPQPADDPVATAQDRAGREAAMIDAAGASQPLVADVGGVGGD